jgi:PAS domain S-box-containing protein
LNPSLEAERLRLFISRITDYAIYMLAPDGTVASWNAGAERFKGYAADEIIGQHFSRFYTARDRAAGIPEKALRLARETGKFEAEGWRVRKDGTEFWASVVIDPIRDESGELVGFAKITRDISDKRARAGSAARKRAALPDAGPGRHRLRHLHAVSHGRDHQLERRCAPYQAIRAGGGAWHALLALLHRRRPGSGQARQCLAEATSRGRFEAEGWRVRKDGTKFWAHVVIDSIHNDAGELIGFAKITRDITERQQAAQALEKAREILFQSQKLEAIGKLTGGVAHDFNNLLSVITNGLDLLRPIVKDPEGLGLIGSMEKAAMRGASLTNQLLTFARQQPVTPEPRELNRVIAGFESVLRRGTRSSVKFELALAGELPAVQIDMALFETALLNLVVNANDATLDGGSIRVTTHVEELEGGRIGVLPAEGTSWYPCRTRGPA